MSKFEEWEAILGEDNDTLFLKNIEYFMDVNYSDYPFLHEAIVKDADQVIKAILKHIDDPDRLCSTKWGITPRTPLQLATDEGKLSIVKLLINGHADVNCQGACDTTPLYRAIFFNHFEIATYLLKYGAEFSGNEYARLVKKEINKDFLVDIGYCRRKKNIKKLMHAFFEPKGSTYEGYYQKNTSPRIRSYHSFSPLDKERQLLRHIGTQIYYALHAYSSLTTEVQVMYLSCNSKTNLFIAVNEFSVGEHFDAIIKKPLQGLLIKDYSENLTLSGEAALRTKRYSEKIQHRIYDREGYFPEGTVSDHIAGMLRNLKTGQQKSLVLDYGNTMGFLTDASIAMLQNTIFPSCGKIYFIKVENCSYKERHAEEFLSDIAAQANRMEDYSSIIGGKKRPCLGCSGRMRSVPISNYNKFPGLFWKHTAEKQVNLEAINNIIELLDEPLHKTSGKDGKPYTDFDSGSDSDSFSPSPH